MTEQELRGFRELIEGQIKELAKEVERHRASSRPVEPDVAIGRLTRMEAISARGISEASLASAMGRLTGLKNALNRIDSGDFGLCVDCDEPIPLKRLMLMPEAVRCVRCAEDR